MTHTLSLDPLNQLPSLPHPRAGGATPARADIAKIVPNSLARADSLTHRDEQSTAQATPIIILDVLLSSG